MTDFTNDCRDHEAAFVDASVLTDARLPALVRIIYTALTTYCDADGVAEVSHRQLSQATSLSERSVHRCLKEGSAHGVWSVTRPGGFGSPNRYKLNDFAGPGENPRKAYFERYPDRLPTWSGPSAPQVLTGWKARRLRAVAAVDGWRCAYCWVDLANPTISAGLLSGLPYPEVDHRVPRSRGGSNRLENLCLACKPCNQLKSDIPLDELPSEWWASSRLG